MVYFYFGFNLKRKNCITNTLFKALYFKYKFKYYYY